jgi:hypothetical protein
MVRIFKDKGGEFLVQTTCLDVDSFLSDFAEALSGAIGKANGEADMVAYGALQNAMPIAFKLAGYKADTVSEQRTLVCGRATPSDSDLLVTVGR